MRKAFYIGLTLYLIFLILVNLFIWDLPSEDSTEKVNCYDKHDNKIIGEVCEENSLGFPLGSKIFGSIFALFLGLIFFKMEDF